MSLWEQYEERQKMRKAIIADLSSRIRQLHQLQRPTEPPALPEDWGTKLKQFVQVKLKTELEPILKSILDLCEQGIQELDIQTQSEVDKLLKPIEVQTLALLGPYHSIPAST